MAGTILGYALSWLYSALLESGPKQATLGKRLLDLKVTNMEGERISFGQATGRHFGKYLSAIILCIGFLMMLWDGKKQRCMINWRERWCLIQKKLKLKDS